MTRTATERHDAERVAAAAERPRDKVRWVDAVGRAADDAGPAGDGEPLAVGRRHRRGSLQRRRSAQGCAGAQLGAPAKRCSLHRCSFRSWLWCLARAGTRAAPRRRHDRREAASSASAAAPGRPGRSQGSQPGRDVGSAREWLRVPGLADGTVPRRARRLGVSCDSRQGHAGARDRTSMNAFSLAGDVQP